MEVLLGIQQLVTHRMENKNWADESDNLTKKEHEHITIIIFFFRQRELWDSKEGKHITHQLTTKKLGLGLVQKEYRLTPQRLCARDYSGSDPG